MHALDARIQQSVDYYFKMENLKLFDVKVVVQNVRFI